ncbi:MAG: CHAT domain-containing protein [Sinobacteraceae bacterium]|nr:CHAT domain-containing protein [Nevskiaceae bacterium]
MKTWRRSICLGSLLLAPLVAHANNQHFALAATGRFDELARLIEVDEQASSKPLRTADRHALCFAYSKIKRYDKLLPCLDRLEERIRGGDLRTRLLGLDDGTPTVHVMRADALIELGQYSDAIDEAQKGLKWLREADSDDLDMIVNLMAAVSLAATLDGDREAGSNYARELEDFQLGLLGRDYLGTKAMALGRVYMALGEFDKAVKAIESDTTFGLRSFLDNLVSGATLRGVNNWLWAELPRNFMITKAYFETGRIDEARRGYDELLGIPQVRANGEIYWQLLSDRARIHELDGEIDKALERYREAVEVIERQRLSINTETNKIGFVGDKQAVYGRLVDALYRAGRIEQTFEYIERSKARALVDLLATKNELKGASLAALTEADRLAIEQAPADMDALANSAQREAEAARLTAELRRNDPELASLVTVTAVPIADIQSRLLADEVVLQYYLSGEQLFIGAVTKDAVSMQRVVAGDLAAKVRRLRVTIQEDEDENRTREYAKELHDILLGPVRPLAAGKSLLVVPHGVLHYLPFAALYDGSDYLMQNTLIRFLPSASTIRFLRAPSGTQKDPVLVLANPDLKDPSLDLPFAETEGKYIAQSIPSSEIFARAQASEEIFKARAPMFRMLHVASHGEFNGANALQSRLLLAKSGTEDGSLTVGDLYNMRLDADLVTLSACETGLGKVQTGDDVLGLTRGFLFAGSSNIVASQWKVDDQATGVLMQHFYANLSAGKPKREALRDAQRETRKAFAHPFYWAAFYLTGLGV